MPPRQDDAAIADDVVLWRAVHRLQVYVADDGRERAQTWAFESDTNEVSASIAVEIGLEQFSAKFPQLRIAEFTAGQARECSNIVARDPTDDDPAHVVICPIAGKTKSRIKKDARLLASKARLLP